MRERKNEQTRILVASSVMDRTDSTKFKIVYPADVRYVLFKTQSIVKNDIKSSRPVGEKLMVTLQTDID